MCAVGWYEPTLINATVVSPSLRPANLMPLLLLPLVLPLLVVLVVLVVLIFCDAEVVVAGTESNFMAAVTLAPTAPPHDNCCTQVASPSFADELHTAGGLV